MSLNNLYMIVEGRRIRVFEDNGAVVIRIADPLERLDTADGLAMMINEVNGIREELKEAAAALVARAVRREREETGRG